MTSSHRGGQSSSGGNGLRNDNQKPKSEHLYFDQIDFLGQLVSAGLASAGAGVPAAWPTSARLPDGARSEQTGAAADAYRASSKAPAQRSESDKAAKPICVRAADRVGLDCRLPLWARHARGGVSTRCDLGFGFGQPRTRSGCHTAAEKRLTDVREVRGEAEAGDQPATV